ncbi:hydrolase, alpha/beta fold family domain protein [Mycobacterium xenopi 3993]|nr:hydrolase, alpha/beta fold family domain protein [Mycobacterium xenopi 3993]
MVGMSRHATLATALVAVTTLLAGCVPGLAANPGSPPIPARDRAARPPPRRARRAAADRGAQERLVVARLHRAGLRRRRSAGRAGHQIGLREL